MRSGRGHHDPEPGLWDSEWRFGRGRAWRGWRREVPEFRRPVPSRGRTPLAQVAEMGSDSSAVGRRRGVAAGAGAQPVRRLRERTSGGKATAHPEPRHRAGRPLHLPPGAGLAPTGGEAAGQGRRAPESGRGPPLRSRPWVRQRPKNQASREPSVACSPQGAPFGSSVTHGPAMAAGRTRSGQPAPHSQPCPPQDSGRAGGAGGSSGLPPIPASQRRCSPTPCTAWAALRVTAPVLRARACSPRTGARRSGSDLLALPRLASAAHSSGPRPDLAQVTQA